MRFISKMKKLVMHKIKVYKISKQEDFIDFFEYDIL